MPFFVGVDKNAPLVRPNTVGQMGCCSFRGAPCFCLRLIFQPMAPGHVLQIFLRIAIQNQIRIAKRVIVDEMVQL